MRILYISYPQVQFAYNFCKSENNFLLCFWLIDKKWNSGKRKRRYADEGKKIYKMYIACT